MSYILDALRKSDRERRAGEAPMLEIPAGEPQPPHPSHRRPFWLITALAAFNAAILGYLLLREDGPAPATPQKPVEKAAAPIRPPAAKAQIAQPQLQEAGKAIEQAPTPRPSISEMLEQSRQIPPPAATGPVRDLRRAEETKNAAVKPPASAKSAFSPEAPTPLDADAETERSDAKLDPPQTQPDQSAEKSGEAIPFLQELPREFQRNMPTLAINVYVYADDPADRFVIVNMGKYRTGQRIMDGPLIEAIESDSLILSYQGKKFRLERP